MELSTSSASAKSGAIGESAGFSDPSLQLIVEHWDKIPDALKLEIVVRITAFVASSDYTNRHDKAQ